MAESSLHLELDKNFFNSCKYCADNKPHAVGSRMKRVVLLFLSFKPEACQSNF